MTKSEFRMSKECRNPKIKWTAASSRLSPVWISGFGLPSSLAIRHSDLRETSRSENEIRGNARPPGQLPRERVKVVLSFAGWICKLSVHGLAHSRECAAGRD